MKISTDNLNGKHFVKVTFVLTMYVGNTKMFSFVRHDITELLIDYIRSHSYT